jgi:hypothetical protein
MNTKLMAIAGVSSLALAGAAPALAGKKPPKDNNQVSIAANPVRILYLRTSVVSGKVTGSDHAGKQVTLQEDPYPFDSFKAKATATTDAGGDYTFTVQPSANTRYRVIAKTTPDVTSATALVQVVPRLSLSVSDGSVSKGSRVTFGGRLAPAHDGGVVLLQRRTSTGSWATLSSVTLGDDGTARSKYAASMRVQSTGVYRTLFKADADHGTAKSSARRVTVS